MRRACLLIIALAVALAGCGGVDSSPRGRGASPQASSPQPTTWPTATRLTGRSEAGRLYVISNVVASLSPDGTSMVLAGRVSAVDVEMGRDVWSVATAQGPDAILAPDGLTLFVATHAPGELRSIDTRSGADRWRVPLEHAIDYTLGSGPPSLAVSEDGSELYVYSYDPAAGGSDASSVPHWVQVFDTANGTHLADTERWTNGCPAQLHASKYGPSLALVCWGSPRVLLLDLAADRLLSPLTVESGIAGSVLAPDGGTLYVVGTDGDVSAVDIEERRVVARATLDIAVEGVPHPLVPNGLVALSPDGTRLFVGVQVTPISSGGTWEARLLAFDTTNWQALPVRFAQTFFGPSLAVRRDGDVVFASVQRYRGQTSIPASAAIIAMGTDAAAPEMAREGEEVLRLLLGP